jgi:VWFA-related protein
MMRRVSAVALTSALAVVSLGGAQQPAPVPADPSVQFRTGVDLIQLDVTVLDKDRRPVRGLTRDDFTVFENGKPQTLVAVAEVDAVDRDAPGSAHMRFTPRDVAANDITDQVGDGRIVAIVIDDSNLPYDSLPMAIATRSLARYIVDSLGPSDVAAVIFTLDAGLTVDFTNDRARLLAAIDAYEPHHREWLDPNTPVSGPIGGDLQRSSPLLAGSTCLRAEPAVPAMSAVTARLASIPGRRKSLMFLSVGVGLRITATSGCAGVLADEMKDVFRYAQRGNVNIHTIDPAGHGGYAAYVDEHEAHYGTQRMPYDRNMTRASAPTRFEFMQEVAENTGGRAVVGTDDLEAGVDQVLTEDASYYLVGYQTANGRPDGRFRRVEVKVRRPGVIIRARSGYWAPEGDKLASRSAGGETSIRANQYGLADPVALPLRAIAVPIGPASANPAQNDVLVGLTVRLPAPRTPRPETLTIVRNVYDAAGNAGPPVVERRELTIEPTRGDDVRYDSLVRLPFAPGHYQIRFNATSQALEKSGTVFVDVDVPDLRRVPLTLTPVVFGNARRQDQAADEVSARMPVVPTTARDFGPNETIAVFARVFQGGDGRPDPVTLRIQVLDRADRTAFSETRTLGSDAFGRERSADYTLALPFPQLTTGRYLLTITASLGARSVRQDTTFRVR